MPSDEARGATPTARALDGLMRWVERALVLMLVTMLALVLGNVVLRYGFGTGISVSEELSRLLFIWVVFVGAVIASRERTHLNVDLLSRVLSRRGRWLLAMFGESVVVACCLLVVWGTAQQHDVTATTTSLIMGFPMILMYGVAYVCGAGIGCIGVVRVVQMLREGPQSRLVDPPGPAHEPAREVVA